MSRVTPYVPTILEFDNVNTSINPKTSHVTDPLLSIPPVDLRKLPDFSGVRVSSPDVCRVNIR